MSLQNWLDAGNLALNQCVTFKQLSRQYLMLQCVGRTCPLVVFSDFFAKIYCVLPLAAPCLLQQLSLQSP
jgi:hypothetical protein